jgi:2,3-diaminopropionate biosynthesis protein SbnB
MLLKGHEIIGLLVGKERELMEVVGAAYISHARGASSLPHSQFLSFPNEPLNRVIALPAFLGDEVNVAGIKWIASFPGNCEKGFDRASAVLILNSHLTGRPLSIMEGSIISAKRTAASAALAARCLHDGSELRSAGLIGCGAINFEIARFLLASFPLLSRFHIYDKVADHAHRFKRKCRELSREVEVVLHGEVNGVLSRGGLIAIATTAIRPFIENLENSPAGTTILNISLRDLTPEAILSCDNVVDDVGHVCRAQTSIHLAQQLVGNSDFIKCTLAELLTGRVQPRAESGKTAIFSPFGLGVLDLAVGKFVYELALQGAKGTVIPLFLPPVWTERHENGTCSLSASSSLSGDLSPL